MADPVSHVSSVWSKATELRIERGHGAHVVDVDGNEYLDFTGGRGAASTGYAHPKVTQAIADQAAKIVHAQINVYRHDKLAPLAAKLATITPAHIDTFYFGTTPDEIIESAVKLAKHATDRRNVVVFDGAFHGRTHYTLAMSSSRVIDPRRLRAAPRRRVHRTVPRPARVRSGSRGQPSAPGPRPAPVHAGAGGQGRSHRDRTGHR